VKHSVSHGVSSLLKTVVKKSHEEWTTEGLRHVELDLRVPEEVHTNRILSYICSGHFSFMRSLRIDVHASLFYLPSNVQLPLIDLHVTVRGLDPDHSGDYDVTRRLAGFTKAVAPPTVVSLTIALYTVPSSHDHQSGSSHGVMSFYERLLEYDFPRLRHLELPAICHGIQLWSLGRSINSPARIKYSEDEAYAAPALETLLLGMTRRLDFEDLDGSRSYFDNLCKDMERLRNLRRYGMPVPYEHPKQVERGSVQARAAYEAAVVKGISSVLQIRSWRVAGRSLDLSGAPLSNAQIHDLRTTFCPLSSLSLPVDELHPEQLGALCKPLGKAEVPALERITLSFARAAWLMQGPESGQFHVSHSACSARDVLTFAAGSRGVVHGTYPRGNSGRPRLRAAPQRLPPRIQANAARATAGASASFRRFMHDVAASVQS
jgi:hypothetical protein